MRRFLILLLALTFGNVAVAFSPVAWTEGVCKATAKSSAPQNSRSMVVQLLDTGCLAGFMVETSDDQKLSIQFFDKLNSAPKWQRTLDGVMYDEPVWGEDWELHQNILLVSTHQGFVNWSHGLALSTGDPLWTERNSTIFYKDASSIVIIHCICTSSRSDLKEQILSIFNIENHNFKSNLIFPIPN